MRQAIFLFAMAASCFSAPLFAEEKCVEGTVTTTTSTIEKIEVAPEDHNVWLHLTKSNGGPCFIEIVAVGEGKVPAECVVGATVTATGKIRLNDVALLSDLTEVYCH